MRFIKIFLAGFLVLSLMLFMCGCSDDGGKSELIIKYNIEKWIARKRERKRAILVEKLVEKK